MRKRKMGLRTKISLFFLLLVLMVVLVIAFPLSSFVINNQRSTLAEGLYERINVMLTSLSTTVAGIIETNLVNNLDIIRTRQEFQRLVAQTEAMPEIEYVTISSIPNPVFSQELDAEGVEYVWLSNDPLLNGEGAKRGYLENIPDKLMDLEYLRRELIPDTGDMENLGRYRVSDAVSDALLNGGIDEFNNLSSQSEIASLIDNLGKVTAVRIGAGLAELRELQKFSNTLEEKLRQILSSRINPKSIPVYNSKTYDIGDRYFSFYYPIYWLESDYSFSYRGTVRIGITTQNINGQILQTQRTILIQVGIIAFVAIAAGVSAALVIASVTVNPINTLVTAVELISNTEVKAELKDKPIVVKTKDEISFLADSINKMTYNLIKDEAAKKSLMAGKDVQKMYISLDPNPHNPKTKATTLHEVTDHIEFFGYYEGAKGVSGDYFYYQKISPDTYAMIKCDVSGKDIEASLIMVTVATLFLEHFNNWQAKRVQQVKIARALKQTKTTPVLSALATTINEIIYARDFKGKFAAFNMITLNEQSGAITFCNAGDNVVHIFRKKHGKVVEQHLQRTPAAGAVSEKIIGMPIDFPEEPGQLEPGDILLFFTDGYEEARRYLRNPDWSIIQKEDMSEQEKLQLQEDIIRFLARPEDDVEQLIQEGKDSIGEFDAGMGEIFSNNRIHDIVDAVMNKKTYRLEKFLNPVKSEILEFDFSSLEGDLSHLVLALMSVEKVFRLVPLPNLSEADRISVDKKVDEFLKTYFVQYDNYFHHPLEEDSSSLYRRFSHIAEDDQYDDLTILAVEKK